MVTGGAITNPIPDVLRLYFQLAHRLWMDIFQRDVEAHLMPRFPVGSYLVLMLALGAYYVAQLAPPTKAFVRAVPRGVVVVAINVAHRQVPDGVVTHRAGYLVGRGSPLIVIAFFVRPFQVMLSRRRSAAVAGSGSPR